MARSRLTAVRPGHTEPTRRPGDLLVLRLPELRAALEQQLRFRRDQLAELEAGEHARGSGGTEPPDRRNEEAVYGLHEVDALVVAGARQALADIELALVRMRTGRYGYCRSCGARIPLVLLRAIPRTTLCLACQQHG
jgi:DnaK suppressor protein